MGWSCPRPSLSHRATLRCERPAGVDRVDPVDTEKLEIFLRIVESGSIQGASRKLGVTRTSLRRVLDSLEAEVGAPLFHRDATGVQVTAAGAILVQQGGTLLECSRAMILDARVAVGQATGVLRVIEPVGLPLALQARIILTAHLALPHQAIAVRLVEDPLAHVDEPFELMLHEGPAPGRSGWFSRVILRTPLRLKAAPGYLRRHGRPREPGELAQHETLGWTRPGQSTNEWPLLAGGVVRVAPWLISPDPQLLHTVLSAGGGIMLAPNLPFIDEPDAEPLETLLADQVGTELVFRVSTPFPMRADSRTRDTLKLILDQLAELPED